MRRVLVCHRTWRKPSSSMYKQLKKDVVKRHSIWESYMRQTKESPKTTNKQQSGMLKPLRFITHQQKVNAESAC